MSEIIYLKDIIQAKTSNKRKNKTTRPKLKPFKYEKLLKSSLVEKVKKEEIK